MLFFLRKLIEALFLPLGLAGSFVIIGLVLRRRWLVLTGIALLYAFSLPVVSRHVIAPLESVYPAQTVPNAPLADAIVVLNGAIIRGVKAGEVQWGDNSNRYFEGLDLATANKARYLVLSPGAPPRSGALDQGSVMRDFSLHHGFPPDRIIVSPYALTTEAEARTISALPGIHSILLVTSAFHMPRAAMLFRARGMLVQPFPADQRVLGSATLGSLAWIPEPSELHDSQMALREYYGLAIYKTLLFFHGGKM
jgi:uncharacterized SAM-binding protein YcdF (DUF218 family)